MITVRPLSAADWDGWRQLYLGYADFYGVETNDEKLSTLFGWLLDPDHVCDGLLRRPVTPRSQGWLISEACRRRCVALRSDFLMIYSLAQGHADPALPRLCSGKLTGLPASVAGVSSDGLRGMEITGPAVFTTAWRKDLTGSPMR